MCVQLAPSVEYEHSSSFASFPVHLTLDKSIGIISFSKLVIGSSATHTTKCCIL